MHNSRRLGCLLCLLFTVSLAPAQPNAAPSGFILTPAFRGMHSSFSFGGSAFKQSGLIVNGGVGEFTAIFAPARRRQHWYRRIVHLLYVGLEFDSAADALTVMHREFSPLATRQLHSSVGLTEIIRGS